MLGQLSFRPTSSGRTASSHTSSSDAAPSRRCSTARLHVRAEAQVAEAGPDSAPSSEKNPRFDARAFRRSLGATGRYVRKPENDAESLALMEEHGVGYSSSGLVAQMRDTGFLWKQGDVTVKLAEAYGFCWGVERAVQMAVRGSSLVVIRMRVSCLHVSSSRNSHGDACSVVFKPTVSSATRGLSLT